MGEVVRMRVCMCLFNKLCCVKVVHKLLREVDDDGDHQDGQRELEMRTGFESSAVG